MLKFLGIGSCFNTDMGNTSAYYIDDGKLILFDCGETVFDAILKRDLLKDITEVDIYITHLHSDHVGSLPSFIFYLYLAKDIKPTIWFPNADLVNWLKLGNVPDAIYNFMIPIDNRKSIYVVKQNHTIVQSAFGYIVKIKDKWIYYSGDANSFELKLRRAPEGFYVEDKGVVLSQIYHDVTRHCNTAHINIVELVNTFPEAVRKYVTLMHFDDNETIEIAKAHGFNVATIEK